MAGILRPYRTIPAYDRSEWKHWIDSDQDCQNTRHELFLFLDIHGNVFLQAFLRCTGEMNYVGLVQFGLSSSFIFAVSFKFLSPANVDTRRNSAKKPAENDLLKSQQKRLSFQLQPKSLFLIFPFPIWVMLFKQGK